jgi:HEAT repeat protein
MPAVGWAVTFPQRLRGSFLVVDRRVLPMHFSSHFRHVFPTSNAVVIMVTCFAAAVGLADRFPPDPVEELRLALKAPLQRLTESREQYLTKRADAVRSLGDLRRALVLQEWRPEQETASDEAALTDRRIRQRLVERFREDVRDRLKRGGTADRLATMSMLAEMGASVRSAKDEDRKGVARTFAPDLVDLMKGADTPRAREMAARTLGQIFPDPEAAVPALHSLLDSKVASERRAAAAGLASLTRVAGQLATKSSSAGSVQADRGDVVQVGLRVIPVAARYLNDSDPDVRRPSAEAIQEAALAMYNQVPQTRPGESALEFEADAKEMAKTRDDLLPLMRSLADQAPVLARALASPDPEVRLHARRTFEFMGSARGRLLSRGAAVQPVRPQQADDDPLLEGLRIALPALSVGLTDPDPQARLDTVDVLESLGAAVAPVAPALVRTLADPNRFVRWAAARTLGKAAPGEAESAVPALAKLLYDPDLDVRVAAALALERYGPAAKSALPDLAQSVRGFRRFDVGAPFADVEFELAVIHTIEGIGTGASPAIPGLAAALSDEDARIRQAAAEALGKFGKAALQAGPALSQALNDTNPEVRKAANDALLKILQKL